ncbi:undecaprenyldiphospho-muramoylpentapeptide beta-N-acetylglucosaminyltransferase [bacterium]|nr:undecaprenyldiphospho-muramoylpentapeptide beta-N-acetylglucosaminyltransferase [bacterium]
MSKRLNLVVCGGGTGGHVIPALSICRKIKELKPEVNFLYIGAAGSIEERMAKEEGYKFSRVWISSLERGKIKSNLILPFKVVISICQAIVYLLKHRAKFVLGTGGFSAFPACAAARVTGRPYVLWEPNAYPGLVTRLMARGANRIYISFNEVMKKLPGRAERFMLTGNPVQIVTGETTPDEARSLLGLEPDRSTIFVTGGSGGAKSINTAVDQAKNDLLDMGFNLIWQTGKQWETEPETASKYENRVVMDRFFNRKRMSLAYSAADMAVARCGAMTLSELAAVGLPALLIPFPYSADGHQEANAREVEAAGGCKVLLDEDLSPTSLIEAIKEITRPDKRREMAEAMKEMARTDAAERIALDILELTWGGQTFLSARLI